MRRFEWLRQADDGLKLFAQCWQPDSETAAVVCLVHGLGEHSSRYGKLAATLTDSGYALMAFDHRGHGRSQGPRGHTPTYDTFLDDIGRMLDEAAARFPDRPRFIYGHSMGGNLALNYVLRRRPELAGSIVTSPWLRTAFAPPAWRVALGRAMNNIMPSFAQPSGLDVQAIARDAAVVRAYQDDPLIHYRISARLFVACYDAGLWALDHAAEFPLPLLIMHGGADRITSSDATREFAAKAPRDCTLKIWGRLYHELHNEPEQQEVFAFSIDWLKQRTPVSVHS
jgi:alpha-beta hydrolase superfamily lysophospholipase